MEINYSYPEYLATLTLGCQKYIADLRCEVADLRCEVVALREKQKENLKEKSMKIYVVTISCNLDDVIVGCYADKEEALLRMDDCIENLEIRHDFEHIQSTDSEPVLVRVASYRGTDASHIEQTEYTK